MIHVLMLPMCKADSFGGIQSFVATMVATAASGEYGVAYQVASPRWYEDIEGGGRARLRELLSGGTVDLIHSHNLHVDARHPIAATVEELAAACGVPHLMTIHDVPWFESVRRVLAPLSRTILITQSRYNQERLWTMIRRRATLLPICIEFAAFPTESGAEMGTVAFPGRVAPHKGGLQAIDVAGVVARRTGRVRLLFSDAKRWSFGQSAEYLDALRRAAARTPGVEIEFVEDPGVTPRIYRRAMLTLCLPQRAEGFGMTALESLACGCPVVAVPTGGMQEWLKDLPGCKQPCDSRPESVAEAVEDVLANWPRYREQALSSRERLQSQFGVAEVLRKHFELYREILGGPDRWS